MGPIPAYPGVPQVQTIHTYLLPLYKIKILHTEIGNIYLYILWLRTGT